MSRLAPLGMLVVCLLFLVGCRSETVTVTTSSSSSPVSLSPSTPSAPPGKEVDWLTADGTPTGNIASPFLPINAAPQDAVTTDGLPDGPATAAPGSELVAAKAGVGIKGRSLDQHEGFVVTPAKTLFTAREKIVFEIAIPHSLNLYKATAGEGPRSHEEFMQKIVEEQNIKLPQLPPGHRYVYDPTTEQLMVERPKKSLREP